MSSFLREALSVSGEPSSKRLLAAFSLLIAVVIIVVNVVMPASAVPFTHYFDGILVFAAACLGGTVVEKFSQQDQTPP